ncbi:MAG: hypothetical protein RJB37_4177, partial [Pseudomonadota bacterium]
QGRACIYAIDLATGRSRTFAAGLRNPVGLAWEPTTQALWTVVNERDGLGDETPPDYLTSVRDGGFYGWPYSYWGGTVDDRVPQDAAAVARAIAPDYALGGHTASLGLCWMPAGTLPGFPDGMVIGQHGSWNRSTLSGYRVLFIPFAGGKPSGPPRDILSGFLAPDESVSYGRPVGVTIGADGRSLLVADDVGNAIWRVTAAQALDFTGHHPVPQPLGVQAGEHHGAVDRQTEPPAPQRHVQPTFTAGDRVQGEQPQIDQREHQRVDEKPHLQLHAAARLLLQPCFRGVQGGRGMDVDMGGVHGKPFWSARPCGEGRNACSLDRSGLADQPLAMKRRSGRPKCIGAARTAPPLRGRAPAAAGALRRPDRPARSAGRAGSGC